LFGSFVLAGLALALLNRKHRRNLWTVHAAAVVTMLLSLFASGVAGIRTGAAKLRG